MLSILTQLLPIVGEVIDRVIRAALNGEGSETLRIGDK